MPHSKIKYMTYPMRNKFTHLTVDLYNNTRQLALALVCDYSLVCNENVCNFSRTNACFLPLIMLLNVVKCCDQLAKLSYIST